jgi:hypothetical protein
MFYLQEHKQKDNRLNISLFLIHYILIIITIGEKQRIDCGGDATPWKAERRRKHIRRYAKNRLAT